MLTCRLTATVPSLQHCIATAGILLALIWALACDSPPSNDQAPQTLAGLDPGDYGWIKTNHPVDGSAEIVFKLLTGEAPLAVANFIGLANGTQPYLHPRTGERMTGHFYDGLEFHRLYGNSFIHGGDPWANSAGGPGYTYPADEVALPLFDEPGIVALANNGQTPIANGCQFFITLEPLGMMNGRYTPFGRVVRGLDVARAISLSPLNRFQSENRPLDKQVMKYVRAYTVDAQGNARLAQAEPLPDDKLTWDDKVLGPNPFGRTPSKPL